VFIAVSSALHPAWRGPRSETARDLYGEIHELESKLPRIQSLSASALSALSYTSGGPAQSRHRSAEGN